MDCLDMILDRDGQLIMFSIVVIFLNSIIMSQLQSQKNTLKSIQMTIFDKKKTSIRPLSINYLHRKQNINLKKEF